MKKSIVTLACLAALVCCSRNNLNIGSVNDISALPSTYEEMSLYAETLDGFVLEEGQEIDSLFLAVLRDCNVPVACADSIREKAELFKHAKTLMDGIVSVDTHCDLAELRYYHPERGYSFGESQSRCRYSLEKMRQGHLAAVCMAAWISPLPEGQLDPGSIAAAPDTLWKFVDSMECHFGSFEDRCGIARNSREAAELHREGKKVVMYALENGHWIGNDIANIGKLADRGFVYITLSHSGDNQICNSANKTADENVGLSDFGREVVREMNRLGVLIDISHTSIGTQREVIELSTKPVIYTHSSCRALYDNPRNVDDDLLRALAAKGGVIQITMFPGYLGPREKRNTIGVDEFVEHVCHAVEVAGIDHVGVGTDFDGGGKGVGFDSANDAVNLTMKLIQKGFSDEDIAKIWGGNFFRLLDEVQAAGAQ